jgi:uncharacterized DUF497 family protein
MRITFDEHKRETNIAKHGMDFALLDLAFFENAAIFPARQGRALALGELHGDIVVAVIFKSLGAEAVSVISMRPASRKERSLL